MISRQSGFTLIELVVILIIVGIVAAAAISRYGDEEAFRVRIAQENLISALHQAQQLAMQGPNVSFKIINTTPASYSVELNGAPYSLAGLSYPQSFHNSISLTPSSKTFIYDELGGTGAQKITLSTTSGDSLAVCVVASGFAHAC